MQKLKDLYSFLIQFAKPKFNQFVKWFRGLNYTNKAFFITKVWFGGIALLGLLILWAGKDSPLSLNEFGDFLAGIFSPLALLWLIAGFMRQGEELRQNTKALELQEAALQAQVSEMQQMVRVQRASFAPHLIAKWRPKDEGESGLPKSTLYESQNIWIELKNVGVSTAIDIRLTPANPDMKIAQMLLSSVLGDGQPTSLFTLLPEAKIVIDAQVTNFNVKSDAFDLMVSYKDAGGQVDNLVIPTTIDGVVNRD